MIGRTDRTIDAWCRPLDFVVEHFLDNWLFEHWIGPVSRPEIEDTTVGATVAATRPEHRPPSKHETNTNLSVSGISTAYCTSLSPAVRTIPWPHL